MRRKQRLVVFLWMLSMTAVMLAAAAALMEGLERKLLEWLLTALSFTATAILLSSLKEEKLQQWIDSLLRRFFEFGLHKRRPEASYRHDVRVAEVVFEIVGLILPRRLRKEEIGDALEVIRSIVNHGGAPWKVYLKIISTIFWLLLNTLRELVSAFAGKAKSTGSSDET